MLRLSNSAHRRRERIKSSFGGDRRAYVDLEPRLREFKNGVKLAIHIRLDDEYERTRTNSAPVTVIRSRREYHGTTTTHTPESPPH